MHATNPSSFILRFLYYSFKKGEMVYSQGETREEFYMLHSGVCQACSASDFSRTLIHAGEVFGHELQGNIEEQVFLPLLCFLRRSHCESLYFYIALQTEFCITTSAGAISINSRTAMPSTGGFGVANVSYGAPLEDSSQRSEKATGHRLGSDEFYGHCTGWSRWRGLSTPDGQRDDK